MDHMLNEDNRLLRDAVRQFAEAEIKPLAQELDEKEQFSTDLTQKMGDMGLLGITSKEQFYSVRIIYTIILIF